MTEKQINKWLRRRFSSVGWVLIGYYVVMNLLVYLSMILDIAKQSLWSFAAGDYSGMLDMDAIAGNAWGYIAAIAVGLVVLYAWKGAGYWKNTLMVKDKSMSPGVFFCLLSFCIGSQMVNSIWIGILEGILNQFDMTVMDTLESVSGDSDTVSMFLYASILAPVFEEVLFRGYVLRSLQPYGKRFAIMGSAVLFGLFHGNLLQTPYAIAMGLVLGYVTVEYSIRWAVALHMFNNLVLADLLTRLTANLPDMIYNVISLLLFGGFLLISVVILIVKHRQIRAYNRSEWMDRRCVKCLLTNSGFLVLVLLMLVNMLLLLIM